MPDPRRVPSWTEHYLDNARLWARKSKDRSTQHGAVFVGPGREVRSVGYNGFPRGIDDHVEARHERPAKYLYTEHAERNAIYNAARVGIPLLGCTSYQTGLPCSDCARGLIQVGMSEVIVPNLEDDPLHVRPDWDVDRTAGLELMLEAGLRVFEFRGGDLHPVWVIRV